MTKTAKSARGLIFFTTILFVSIASLISVAFFMHQTATSQSPTVDYWILNISSSVGGYVQPSGTVYVPMNQTGISVTATPTLWSGFMYWTLDGERVANQSSTIIVPGQQADSSHTLEAFFVIGTPIVSGLITASGGSGSFSVRTK